MARKLYAGWVVVLGWVIANLLGVAAIGALILILPFLKSIPGVLVSSLIIGLPIGFAQWIALRRVAPISILWVLTISVGLILGLRFGPNLGGIWGFLDLDDESVLALALGPATIGLLVGLMQWLFLRGHFSKSLVWPLSSAIGLGLGTGLILATNLIDQSGIISIILVTVVYAITTGLAIAWLPASPASLRVIWLTPADSPFHLESGLRGEVVVNPLLDPPPKGWRKAFCPAQRYFRWEFGGCLPFIRSTPHSI